MFRVLELELKINFKKTKSLRLGISENEKVMLVTKRLIRVAVSPTLAVLLVKTVGAVKMLKVVYPRLGVFLSVKKSL